MDGLVLFAIAAVYVSALFALAYWAENRRGRWLKPRYRIPAYTLALAVYCTSWTFYGAVGSAVADGWLYLPIYLGPILVYLFGWRFLERLVATVQREGATSIADFIGSRFGKSRTVAALVTLLALLGTIPYLALQLRSVGTSFAEFTGSSNPGLVMGLTAAMLALFAMLFGTRRYEAAGRNDGVLFAVGVESLVKLTALVAAGVFAAVIFMGLDAPVREAGIAALGETFAPASIGIDFFVITLLSMTAIVCLPRQFYIGVIEAASVQDVGRSRLPFVAYLAITSLVVIPIALAGTALVPRDASADLLVLEMPLAAGADALAILVFIGGFSAATGMAIVESVALSTMVSNDLIAPLLLRSPRWANDANLGRVMLTIRRDRADRVRGDGAVRAKPRARRQPRGARRDRGEGGPFDRPPALGLYAFHPRRRRGGRDRTTRRYARRSHGAARHRWAQPSGSRHALESRAQHRRPCDRGGAAHSLGARVVRFRGWRRCRARFRSGGPRPPRRALRWHRAYGGCIR